MKHIFFAVLLLPCFSYVLTAQNRLPQHINFDTAFVIPTPLLGNFFFSDTSYQNGKIHLMWNNANGMPHTIDNYYRMNARLGDIHTDLDKIPQTLSVRDTSFMLTTRTLFNTTVSDGHSGARSHNNPLYGISLHYDVCAPSRTRYIPGTTASYEETYPNWSDSTGGAFGFLSRNGGYDSVFADGNKQRVYREDSVTPGIVILTHPYPNDELMRDEANGAADTSKRDFYGHSMYLSLNVRLLDTNSSSPDDTVLVVRLPYTTKPGKGALLSPTRQIVFDSIPSPSGGLVPINATFRPIYRGSRSPMIAGTRNILFITRRMLCDTASITLSAHFRLQGDFDQNGVLNGSENHALWYPEHSAEYDTTIGGQDYRRHRTTAAASARITRMEPEIIYRGHCDISLDWVRLETKAAKELYSGFKDDLIRQSIQTAINRCSTLWGSYTGRIRWHRIWITEEDLPRTYHANGYANRLFNGRGTTETGYTTAHVFREFDEMGVGIESVDPPYTYYRCGQIQYYIEHSARETGIKENWRGDTYSVVASVPAPYTWRSDTSKTALPYNYGLYNAYFKPVPSPDEVLYNYGTAPSTIPSSTDYRYLWRWPNSSLLMIENAAHRYASDPYFLFDTKHSWYASVWASPPVVIKDFTGFGACTSGVNCPRNSQFEFLRPVTGEELRFTEWFARILGAQGDVIWVNRSKSIVADWDDILINNPPAPNGNNSDLFKAFIGYHTKPTYDNPAPAPNNMSWLRNESLGSDYLHNDDPTFIDKFSPSFSAVADTLGIQAGKFYMGRKTMRYMTKQHHDWVDKVSTTLARLRLDSWYGKGFRTFSLHRSPSAHSRFIAFLDTARLFTHNTIGYDTAARAYTHAATPEPSDSSFFDISILRDKNSTDTNEVYIGMLNRQLDPVFTIPSSVTLPFGVHVVKSGISPLRRFCSLPTPEFDSLLTLTSIPLVANKSIHPYCQRGSRQISLRFKDEVMLRVQELGGTLDTVVNGSEPLGLLFKPGEGRMFRIRPVKHYENTIRKGILAHNNQRKIVGYPIYRQDSTGAWVETDSMYYHAVYHRFDSTYSTFPGESMVFYSRSKPMPRFFDADPLAWDSVYFPSPEPHEIAVPGFQPIWKEDGGIIVKDHCAYPSVVVRRESTGAPKVYITYACHQQSAEENDVIYICESTLPAQGTRNQQVSVMRHSALVETYSNGAGSVQNQLKNWGTPMINASANGNFYCWSDSLQGIGFGWKDPDALYFTFMPQQVDYVAWGSTANRLVDGYPGLAMCKHPSLNSYSRIELGEDNCSLVWQEQHPISGYPGTFGNSDIHYTRIRLDQFGTITTYLPQQNRWSYTFAPFIVFHPSFPIVTIDEAFALPCANDRFPVVYREIHDGIGNNRNLDTMKTMLWEHVYYEHDQTSCNPLMYRPINADHSIAHAVIDLYDRPDALGRMQPDSAHGIPPHYIWQKYNRALYQPDVTQGMVQYRAVTTPLPLAPPIWLVNHKRLLHVNASERALNLNFIEADVSGLPNANATIWQMPHNRYNNSTTTTTEIVYVSSFDDGWVKPLTAQGEYPHLAAIPSIRYPSIMQKNRRIYETDDNDPPSISVSVEQLAKGDKQRTAVPMVGFDSEENTLLMSTVLQEGKKIQWYFSPGKTSSPDTLFTSWFRVGEESSLSMDMIGGRMEGTFFIENKNTRERRDFPLTASSRRETENRLYRLMNGENSEFRLICTNGDKEKQIFRSHLLLRPEEEPMYKAGETETIINLNPLNNEDILCSLYPNPAQDKLFITWTGGNTTVQLINATGSVLEEYPIHGDYALNTQELSNGLFFLRFTNGVHTLTKSFIILK